jgi:aspartyl-tRNA(Asn)/glutamyl-tRNA(Gln) amidotransferase subunit B
MDEYGIPKDDALILTKDRDISDYFSACVSHCRGSQETESLDHQGTFQTPERGLRRHGRPAPSNPGTVRQLVNLVSEGKVTAGIGREILDDMFKTGEDPEAIIDKKGLKPIQDEDQLETFLDEVEGKPQGGFSNRRRGSQAH